MSRAAGRPAPQWVDAAALGAVFAALAVMGWGAWLDVLIDFGRELYVAWRISEGDVLYRDVASFYGPLSPYVNAAVFRLLGVSLRSLVIVNLLILAGTTWMLRALLLRAGTTRLVATAAAALFLSLFGFGHLIANAGFNFVCPYAHEATHGFALAVAALLCALHGPRSVRWAGASGLLCGLAFLTKPESFVGALGASALALLLAGPSPSRARVAGAFATFLALPPLVAWGLLATALPAGDAWQGVLGSWAYAGNAEVRGQSYFGWSAGVDRPAQHLGITASMTAVHAAALLPALGAAWALRGRPRAARWVALAAAAALAALLAFRWGTRGWMALARPLPLWALGLLATSVAGLWRARRAEPERFDAALARTALAAFALLLLPRIFFNARFYHYGFTLAAAATLIWAAALLDWIPRWLDRRGAAGAVFRAVAAVGLCYIGACAVRDSYGFLAAKQVAMGSGGDSFRADLRGRFVSIALENVDRVAREGTLVVLPEGVMINYLLRRRSSIPYLTMLPSDEAQFGEDELLGSLERRPPAQLVLVHRTTEEFGTPVFGSDYAQRTMQWVASHYTPLFTVGDPPLEPGARFGIRLLTRNPEAAR
jgi:hypothetical protein